MSDLEILEGPPKKKKKKVQKRGSYKKGARIDIGQVSLEEFSNMRDKYLDRLPKL
jgi:hypothetical protein